VRGLHRRVRKVLAKYAAADLPMHGDATGLSAGVQLPQFRLGPVVVPQSAKLCVPRKRRRQRQRARVHGDRAGRRDYLQHRVVHTDRVHHRRAEIDDQSRTARRGDDRRTLGTLSHNTETRLFLFSFRFSHFFALLVVTKILNALSVSYFFSSFVCSGLHFLIPWVDKPRRVHWRYVEESGSKLVVKTNERDRIDMRETVIDFGRQHVITKDTVLIDIDALVYYQITDAELAVYKIQNLPDAIELLTQTTLRNIIGKQFVLFFRFVFSFQACHLFARRHSANDARRHVLVA
jgi:hypothetical protein